MKPRDILVIVVVLIGLGGLGWSQSWFIFPDMHETCPDTIPTCKSQGHFIHPEVTSFAQLAEQPDQTVWAVPIAQNDEIKRPPGLKALQFIDSTDIYVLLSSQQVESGIRHYQGIPNNADAADMLDQGFNAISTTPEKYRHAAFGSSDLPNGLIVIDPLRANDWLLKTDPRLTSTECGQQKTEEKEPECHHQGISNDAFYLLRYIAQHQLQEEKAAIVSAGVTVTFYDEVFLDRSNAGPHSPDEIELYLGRFKKIPFF